MKHKTSIYITWICVALCISGCQKKIESENDQVLYALGHRMAGQVKDLSLNEEERKALLLGVRDGLDDKPPATDIAAAGGKIEDFIKQRQSSQEKNILLKNEEYLKSMAAQAGARKSEKGLIYFEKIVGEENGTFDEIEVVKIRYQIRLRDGTQIPALWEDARVIELKRDQLIPCWQEALQLMKKGGRARLICPPELAYGAAGVQPSIPPHAVLEFDFEWTKD